MNTLKSFIDFINENLKPKLSPADEKFIAKFLKDKLDFSTDKITRKNKFTGEEAELDPICAAAYDFVINLEKAMRASNIPDSMDRNVKMVHPLLTINNCVMNFDRARSIVRKLNSDAYYTLLD